MNWGSNHKKHKSLLCLLCFLWFLPSALAQQRPLLTEDPRLIANGSFVMESGFGYAHRARFPLSGLGGDEYSVFVNGLHFGLGTRAEFPINAVVQNLLHVSDHGIASRTAWG